MLANQTTGKQGTSIITTLTLLLLCGAFSWRPWYVWIIMVYYTDHKGIPSESLVTPFLTEKRVSSNFQHKIHLYYSQQQSFESIHKKNLTCSNEDSWIFWCQEAFLVFLTQTETGIYDDVQSTNNWENWEHKNIMPGKFFFFVYSNLKVLLVRCL